MTSKKFIGLIGLGHWGKNLLRNLYELEVLHSACDTDADILEQRKKQFPDVRYSQSLSWKYCKIRKSRR